VTIESDLRTAADALSYYRGGLQKTVVAAKALCTAEGAISPALLDEHQWTVYGIAIASAELAAAGSALRYASDVVERDSVIAEISIVFVTRMLARIESRLKGQLAGIHWPEDIPVEFTKLQVRYSTGELLDRLGTAITDRSGVSEPHLQSEELDMARETFSRFASSVVAPVAQDIHRNDSDIPEHLIRGAAELGCFALCVPERFGGLQKDENPDSLAMVVVTEVLSGASLCAGGSLITRPEIIVRALLAAGVPSQQERWLPGIASGEILTAVAVTESHCGSDVAAVEMKARRVPGGWLLNGAKSWSTFAGGADVILTLARTDPDPASGHRGLSLFLVPKPRFPGHQFRYAQPEGGTLEGQSIPTIGYRGMHTFNLYFEDYFVSGECLVGENGGENRGFYYTMHGFSGGRIQTAARAVGVMQAAWAAAVIYASERMVFGQPVAGFGLTRARLVNMFGSLIACRRFTYEVASVPGSEARPMEASLVKLFACRTAEWLTREAMQIHGAMGYAEESDISRYFVDARVLSIFEGTEEILALKVIGKTLLEEA
jgi:(2S)-methylsuccinyl-CoA dehydrogenase